MADRNLVTYVEPRNEFGPYWRLRIERAASGKPGLFFTIETDPHDAKYYDKLHEELTVFVEDGREVLEPVLEWLNG